MVAKASWDPWVSGFETSNQNLRATTKGFLPTISNVCGMEKLHTPKGIVKYSKNFGHPSSQKMKNKNY